MQIGIELQCVLEYSSAVEGRRIVEEGADSEFAWKVQRACVGVWSAFVCFVDDGAERE